MHFILRKRMKAFGLVEFGYYLSLLLTLQSSTSSAISDECSESIKYLANSPQSEICEAVAKFEKNREDPACIERLFPLLKIRSNYSSIKHLALSALTNNYCNGAGNTEKCIRCFKTAFMDQWNQDVCLCQNSFRLNYTLDCLNKFINNEFILVKRVKSFISKTTEYDMEPVFVNISEHEYKNCSGVFPSDVLPKSDEIIFNINQRLGYGPEFQNVELLLALFLDAVRSNNGQSSDDVTCQHIQDLGLVSDYKKLSEPEQSNIVPEPVTNSFRELRKVMCFKHQNEDSCIECFKEPDDLFIYHFYNLEKKSPIGRDFQQIHSTLIHCINTYASESYSGLQSLIKSSKHANTWKAVIITCSEGFQNYEDIIKTNKRTVAGLDENDALVKSVAANFFAFMIYGATNFKKEHNTTCISIQQSKILCVAGTTVKTITDLYIEENVDKYKELYQLSNDIVKCSL